MMNLSNTKCEYFWGEGLFWMESKCKTLEIMSWSYHEVCMSSKQRWDENIFNLSWFSQLYRCTKTIKLYICGTEKKLGHIWVKAQCRPELSLLPLIYLLLFYSGSNISRVLCVMLLFGYMLGVFGKLKQMGNHEETFCLTGVPSVVPRTAAAPASPGTSRASCRLFGAVVWLHGATVERYFCCNGLFFCPSWKILYLSKIYQAVQWCT